MLSSNEAQPSTSSPRQHVAADHAAGFADAELRRQVDDVGFFETRHRAQEFERLDRLAAAIDLAAGEIVGLEPVDRVPSVARQLGEIDPPFDSGALRPHDRGLARKLMGAGRLGGFHRAGMVRQASPAFSGSMPLSRNIIEG